MRDHRTISIADQIFEQLEKEILSGKYHRGDVLSELKLAEELRVSRTPIREALKRLEQEHIIEEGEKGMHVVGISREEMLDMYDIRIALEGIAARGAAKHATEEQLKEMKDTLDLQKFYIDKDGDPTLKADDIKEMDSKFHRLIYMSCGSRVYSDTLLPLHMKMLKSRKASVSKRSRAQESYEEHLAIYAAIKERNEMLAEERMLHHIAKAKDSVYTMPDSIFN
ncbi:MAG: GntR family transcriptional regulator [Pseudobutyrivibrio sp.]|nr:GntR family transcriptional regulator [Pseudobutyrivibrio sp.]